VAHERAEEVLADVIRSVGSAPVPVA
jgi:hypothetical protein